MGWICLFNYDKLRLMYSHLTFSLKMTNYKKEDTTVKHCYSCTVSLRFKFER